MFVIANAEGQYWTVRKRWGSPLDAEVVSENRRQGYRRPKGGRWKSLWEVDEIQFARLIAEFNAMGIHEDELQTLAESMDLEPENLADIFRRGTEAFDRIKSRLPGSPRRTTLER